MLDKKHEEKHAFLVEVDFYPKFLALGKQKCTAVAFLLIRREVRIAFEDAFEGFLRGLLRHGHSQAIVAILHAMQISAEISDDERYIIFFHFFLLSFSDKVKYKTFCAKKRVDQRSTLFHLFFTYFLLFFVFVFVARTLIIYIFIVSVYHRVFELDLTNFYYKLF